MKKATFLFLIVFAFAIVGCNSGETPVETVQVKTDPNVAPPANSMEGAIQSNPGMPQVAKDAVLGKK